MKTKYLGNGLLIFTLAFLFLTPAFNSAKAAMTCVSCSCVCEDGTVQTPIDFGDPVQNNDTNTRCVERCTDTCGDAGFGSTEGGLTCCTIDPDTNQCAGEESVAQGDCECCNGSPPVGDYRTSEACGNACAGGLGGFKSFNGNTSGSQCPNQPEQQGAQPPAVQQLENPLGAGADIPEIIARVIKAVLGLVGSIGLLMFIYGGFLWLTAGGSEQRVKNGREVLVWATLGLLVIFSAYAILNFVLGALTRSTG